MIQIDLKPDPAAPTRPANTLTPDQVRAACQNCPLIDAELFALLVRGANADPDEGPEWLPYYKLASSLLMYAFGNMARAALTPQQFEESHRQQVMRDALVLAKLSNRICGLGPNDSPEAAARVDAINATFDLTD